MTREILVSNRQPLVWFLLFDFCYLIFAIWFLVFANCQLLSLVASPRRSLTGGGAPRTRNERFAESKSGQTE